MLAIGAPFGFENSATAGIVSAKGRTLDSGYVPFIQTDVPINPGNSGGPLFNMKGEVVGINSQIYSRSGGYQGVSFSIPIDVAMQVSSQLQTSGHVTRGKIGVTIQHVTQGLSDSFGLPQPEGALVSSVEKGGPAEKAGVEPGDVILKLNGQPLNNSEELPVLVAGMTPGSSVNLEIWRNHGAKNLTVTLGALEDKRTAANGAPREQGGKLGLAVRPLSPDEQRQSNTKGGLRGRTCHWPGGRGRHPARRRGARRQRCDREQRGRSEERGGEIQGSHRAADPARRRAASSCRCASAEPARSCRLRPAPGATFRARGPVPFLGRRAVADQRGHEFVDRHDVQLRAAGEQPLDALGLPRREVRIDRRLELLHQHRHAFGAALAVADRDSRPRRAAWRCRP